MIRFFIGYEIQRDEIINRVSNDFSRHPGAERDSEHPGRTGFGPRRIDEIVTDNFSNGLPTTTTVL